MSAQAARDARHLIAVCAAAFAVMAVMPAAAQTPAEIQAALNKAHTDFNDVKEGANLESISNALGGNPYAAGAKR